MNCDEKKSKTKKDIVIIIKAIVEDTKITKKA